MLVVIEAVHMEGTKPLGNVGEVLDKDDTTFPPMIEEEGLVLAVIHILQDTFTASRQGGGGEREVHLFIRVIKAPLPGSRESREEVRHLGTSIVVQGKLVTRITTGYPGHLT